MLRSRCLLLAVALLATACSVAADDLDVALPSGVTVDQIGTAGDDADVLPAVGPVPGSSHWHAAYVVRVCDDVLAPFDSDADPLGIHSHADGVMHVHPFFEESGYEDAKLSHFADAMEFELRDGELTLPGGGTWRDGDLCNGVPGRVFVDRWSLPDPESPVERIFTGLDNLRYRADGELYQIAFAPVDSFPVVPPATALLPELSNLGPVPDPWIDVGSLDATTGLADTTIWEVEAVGGEPCAESALPESVLFGPVRCFTPAGEKLAGEAAVANARAVLFNRRAAIELQMTPQLQQLLAAHFDQSDNPVTLAIQVGDRVITAPQLARPPVSDRLVIAGGLSVEAAERLAQILSQR